MANYLNEQRVVRKFSFFAVSYEGGWVNGFYYVLQDWHREASVRGQWKWFSTHIVPKEAYELYKKDPVAFNEQRLYRKYMDKNNSL